MDINIDNYWLTFAMSKYVVYIKHKILDFEISIAQMYEMCVKRYNVSTQLSLCALHPSKHFSV